MVMIGKGTTNFERLGDEDSPAGKFKRNLLTTKWVFISQY